MKLKIVLPFIALFTLAGCQGFDDYIYETIAMSLSNADNSGTLAEDVSESAPRLAYAIKVEYTMSLSEIGDTDRYESGFQNEDGVTSFTISSPDTFNLIPPNTSLNHLFNFSALGGIGTEINEENYHRYVSGRVFFESGANPKPDWNVSKYLLLMNPPDTAGMYTFVLDILFTDGRQLIDSVDVNLY